MKICQAFLRPPVDGGCGFLLLVILGYAMLPGVSKGLTKRKSATGPGTSTWTRSRYRLPIVFLCRVLNRINSSSQEHLQSQDLMPDMKMYWPDVIHPSSNRTHFWKHEWEKHGTCAAQLDALNSERKYFGKSLALYKQLGLNSMLLKFGIKPSINYYHIADFKDALTRVYGVVPKMQCLPPKQGEQVQTIGQIELCFTKEDLHLRNCTEPGEQLFPKQEAGLAKGAAAQGMVVCEYGPVFYPPPAQSQH